MRTIAIVQFHDRDMAGFLDMLRYDRAVVESWSHRFRDLTQKGNDTWTVTLLADRFTPDRWSSFGLVIRDKNGAPLT